MLLSDELVKLDQLYEQLVNKLIDTLKSTLQNDPDTLHASLLVNNSKLTKFIFQIFINTLIEEFDDYIKTFSWNSMKYRTDKSLREVTDMIIQVIVFIYINPISANFLK
jgi:V-type H+-transporting ATPase subunit C